MIPSKDVKKLIKCNTSTLYLFGNPILKKYVIVSYNPG